MKKIPQHLRLVSTSGVLGGVIGSIIGAWLSLDYYGLSAGFLVGFTIGFIFGYRISRMIETAESIALAEKVSSGVDIMAIILSIFLVVAGFIGLVLLGWNVRLILSILFFLLCALYLAYKRYHMKSR